MKKLRRRCPVNSGNQLVSIKIYQFHSVTTDYSNMVVVAAGTGGAHKVLLISGKQSGSSGGSQMAAFSRPISVVLPASQVSSDSDSNTSVGPPLRKRQRLTHLSPEEKALRRLV